MNCKQAQELFSDRLDGALQGARLERLEQHIASCRSCGNLAASLGEAVGALRGIGPATTSLALRDSILGALDEALGEQAMAPATPRWAGSALSYAGAILVGAAASLACLLWVPAVQAALVPARVVEVAVVREPRVVERIVERLVEVPVRIEVSVEVPVEVPVERVLTVDRWLPAKTVVLCDADALGRVLAGLAASLQYTSDVWARQLSQQARAADPMNLAQGSPAKPEGDSLRQAPRSGPQPRAAAVALPAGLLPDYLASASVTLSSEPGRLTMQTSGPLRSVVPLLLEQLNGGTDDVVALVDRRLAVIRAAALSDPGIGERLKDPRSPKAESSMAERFFGGAREQPSQTPHERWSTWWKANGELVASAGSYLQL